MIGLAQPRICCDAGDCHNEATWFDTVTGKRRCLIHVNEVPTEEVEYGQAEGQEGTREEKGQETRAESVRSAGLSSLSWTDTSHDGRLSYTEAVIVVSHRNYDVRYSVTVEPRPGYCDRGHWVGKAFGPLNLDGQDGFPRYYMDLERAKAELGEWLMWRLQRMAT